MKLSLLFIHNSKFRRSLFVAFALLAVSLIANYYAVHYASLRASGPVDDIILSNTRVYDVEGIFVFGPLAMWLFVAGLLIWVPWETPFTIKSIALFTCIRSAFVSLTHLGAFPTHDVISYQGFIGSLFNSGSDLFFSGHTGLPFLMALIFWDFRPLRYLFLASSVLFGTIVLLGHLHYSIDVFSAFFITYTIFCLARVLFAKDYKAFREIAGHTR